jgi:GNAT superfamily N-acetyltransferase
MTFLIQYREAEAADVQQVSTLILRVFNKYVGSGYSQEGREVFQKFVGPEAILERLNGVGFSQWVATSNKEIIGTIGIRDGNHISLLFVEDRYQRLGIAKNLISLAIEKLVMSNQIKEITVHSSPYALPIYTKLGFLPLDKELEQNRIRYIPMKKYL